MSVIIVSRHRPSWLIRCLKAVAQLDYPRFETLVVACPEGARQARRAADVRVVDFDQPNISAARNLGVRHARGAVLAFIDDDAVPEPTWLSHMAAPFADGDVAQVGGTTLGRNGITVQHAASLVDATGRTRPVHPGMAAPIELTAQGPFQPRLQGTNMALRRCVVCAQGGFDPRFRFYLDDTDMTYRIALAGGTTVIAPRAVVHHASGPSRFRSADRAPRDVRDIAASAAVFHELHCPAPARGAARAAFLAERRRWILRHMQRGTVPPDRAWALIRDLHHGYREGVARLAEPGPALMSCAAPADLPVPERPTGPVQGRDLSLIACGPDRARVAARARTLVAQGARVTVFEYRPDARFHHVAFTDDGYWRHTGGIYGRELRHEPFLTTSTRQARVAKTLERLHQIRSKNPLVLDNGP